MKKKFALLILTFFASVFAAQLFAERQYDVPRKYDPEHFEKAVQKELGHKVEPYEQSIIQTTYFYYYEKNEKTWTKTVWKEAVTKTVELCNNKVAVAAAKAGKFGEKVLQAIAVTTEDAIT